MGCSDITGAGDIIGCSDIIGRSDIMGAAEAQGSGPIGAALIIGSADAMAIGSGDIPVGHSDIGAGAITGDIIGSGDLSCASTAPVPITIDPAASITLMIRPRIAHPPCAASPVMRWRPKAGASTPRVTGR